MFLVLAIYILGVSINFMRLMHLFGVLLVSDIV